jgi:hypothetical protein
MLSELIDCSKRAPKQPERSENASGSYARPVPASAFANMP